MNTKPDKIRLFVIDEKKNSVVLEISPQAFRLLNIKKEEVKHHKSRRKLIQTLVDFLENTETLNSDSS